MRSNIALNKEERIRVAERLIELSEEHLTYTDKPKDYIAIEVGTGNNKNVITLRTNRVSFFIRSTDLLQKLRTAGFTATSTDIKDKYRVLVLSKQDIDRHEDLFGEVVKESVETVRNKNSRKSW